MYHTVTQKQITEVILEGMDPENALFASLTFTDHPRSKVIAKIKTHWFDRICPLHSIFISHSFWRSWLKYLLLWCKLWPLWRKVSNWSILNSNRHRRLSASLPRKTNEVKWKTSKMSKWNEIQSYWNFYSAVVPLKRVETETTNRIFSRWLGNETSFKRAMPTDMPTGASFLYHPEKI